MTKQKQAIHQLLPSLAYGDAISNQARMIRNILILEGYESKIFALTIDPKVAHECEYFSAEQIHPDDALIYHHSVSFDHIEFVIAHLGKKALIYHNITPKDFFEPYNQKVATMLQEGREHLKELADVFDHNYGVSQFNCDELILNGFENTQVLPLLVSNDKWDFLPDSQVLRKYSDHKKNILFTGRLSPNKKQTDLVKMLSCLKQINPNIRLILVGGGKDETDPYFKELKALIKREHLQHDVVITNQVNESELKSYFMLADLFVSMSEHEGFGVPLVEAMCFDIPVLAYKSTAIPETLGDAALMFTDKKDMLLVAGLVSVLLNNREIRRSIIEAQKNVRKKFAQNTIRGDYLDMIKGLKNG